MTPELFTALLAPISTESPAGEDMTFSTEFDELRTARKGDDPSLSQGDWVTDIRTPQWSRVRHLSESLLCSNSKHLQLATWYTEALVHQEGFYGLAFGLRVTEGILNHFWESCFPAYDPSDLEERISRLEWLNIQIPTLIRSIPMTRQDTGGYSWLQWQESRTVENLGKRDPSLRETALAEGKLAGEVFDRAVTASGVAFLENLDRVIAQAFLACLSLQEQMENRFGGQTPLLDEVLKAIQDCASLCNHFLKPHQSGAPQNGAPKPSTPQMPETTHSMPTMQLEASVAVGPIRSRAEAIARLREVAGFFRQNEPHSPVAYLAERAAQWADMPLENWLESVVKDEATLGQLRELLGIR